MLTPTTIALRRLLHQQLVVSPHASVAEVVQTMGAMQAQDYDMAKWAIGVRLPGSTETAVEDAINRGEIVRTHLLRPTWHFVAAADIDWLLELTAPQVRRIVNSDCRRLGIDEAVFQKSNELIARALEGHRYQTREDLMTMLQNAGMQTHELRPVHLMFQAELAGLVCNGPRRGKQHTYALLRERVPVGQQRSRDEALAALATRYFASHGPATLRDFVWWSGLNTTDARKAIEVAKDQLTAEAIDGQSYWFGATAGAEAFSSFSEQIHLLPAFDEYMVSYCDRSASLATEFAKQTNTGNGIFAPIIVVNGQVMGIWKRTVKTKTVVLEAKFFYDLPADLVERIREKARLYADYLQKELVFKPMRE